MSRITSNVGRPENWQELCRQAVAERDTDRLLQLITQIDQSLAKVQPKPARPSPKLQNKKAA
jgi:uncharacterized membrane protein